MGSSKSKESKSGNIIWMIGIDDTIGEEKKSSRKTLKDSNYSNV